MEILSLGIQKKGIVDTSQFGERFDFLLLDKDFLTNFKIKIFKKRILDFLNTIRVFVQFTEILKNNVINYLRIKFNFVNHIRSFREKFLSSINKIFELRKTTFSLVFNLKSLVRRILETKYSFEKLFIRSVTSSKIRVIRTGTYTTQLRCDFHDEDDLTVDNYFCYFWVRDQNNNIYGPYSATIIKESSKEYYATYDLDPTESFLLGPYDIKVEVRKYA
jgi:hypothetical protein